MIVMIVLFVASKAINCRKDAGAMLFKQSWTLIKLMIQLVMNGNNDNGDDNNNVGSGKIILKT